VLLSYAIGQSRTQTRNEVVPRGRGGWLSGSEHAAKARFPPSLSKGFSCGYTGQDTATHEAQLLAAGCTLIRTETVSGGSRNGRNELASILDFIRSGDILIVVKLDRLGRNTRDVLNLVHELEEKGASLRVLEPAIDTGGPMGRMVLTALGMVAEMELGFIRDRQRAGIDAAKAKGAYKGRPVTFDRARIVSLRKEGMGAAEIAKAVGCKRGNVYKTLKTVGLD
jgi:DNA invertase Pin-like site-specific DNA recombinase